MPASGSGAGLQPEKPPASAAGLPVASGKKGGKKAAAAKAAAEVVREASAAAKAAVRKVVVSHGPGARASGVSVASVTAGPAAAAAPAGRLGLMKPLVGAMMSAGTCVISLFTREVACGYSVANGLGWSTVAMLSNYLVHQLMNGDRITGCEEAEGDCGLGPWKATGGSLALGCIALIYAKYSYSCRGQLGSALVSGVASILRAFPLSLAFMLHELNDTYRSKSDSIEALIQGNKTELDEWTSGITGVVGGIHELFTGTYAGQIEQLKADKSEQQRLLLVGMINIVFQLGVAVGLTVLLSKYSKNYLDGPELIQGKCMNLLAHMMTLVLFACYLVDANDLLSEVNAKLKSALPVNLRADSVPVS